MNITNSAKLLTSIIQKNATTILTGLAVGGVVSTAVLAVKATPKALEIIKEHEGNKVVNDLFNIDNSLSFRRKVELTWKCYIPAVATGTLTIACIIASNTISLRRNTAIAGLYSLSETTFKEYKEQVKKEVGIKKEQKITDETAQEIVKSKPVGKNQVIVTGGGDVLFYDVLSGRYFKSDMESVRKVQNDLNQRLLSDMWLDANDLYSALGIDSVEIGKHIGWNCDRNLEFRFSSTITDDGQPCIVLDHFVAPTTKFRDF